MNTRDTLPPNLFKHPNGVYWIRKTINGRRVKVSTGKRDLKAALKVYHAQMVKWDRDGDRKDENLTFDDWWKDYEATYTVDKANQENDRQAVRAAMPTFTRRMLKDITDTICRQAKRDISARFAPSTTTMYCRQLKAIFNKAVERKYLVTNPWNGVEIAQVEGRTEVLEREDQAKLMEVLKPTYQRYLVFMCGTGLRVGQGRLVTKKDLHLDTKHIWLVKFKRTPARFIPMLPEVETALVTQLEEEGQLWPQTNQTMGQVLARACKRAEIPHLHPHVFRHTFATRWLQGGGDIYILSKILGHASVKTTERVYAHLVKEDLLRLAQGIDLGLSGPNGGPENGPTAQE